MPTLSKSGEVNRSSASALDRRVCETTFSPTALNARSLILPRSSALSALMDLALEAFDGEGGVVTTEAKTIAQDCVDFAIDADVGSVVEIELGIRVVVVDRWRDDTVADHHRTDDGFDRASSAEHVT